MENNNISQDPPDLKEMSLVFLKIGATSFGGPAAHLAMMEEELIHRRSWISQDEFLDLLSATNLIPGPNSTEMAIHVGYKLRGFKGLLVAGTSFILPAFFIVWMIAWFYVKFGTLPAFQSVFLGIRPVILAIIAQAIYSLSRSAIKDRILAGLGILSVILLFFGLKEIFILFIVAIANLIFRRNISKTGKYSTYVIMLPITFLVFCQNAFTQTFQLTKVSLLGIFYYFVKVGSVLFGSGYVLIAFFQGDLVDKYHWISQKQLIDAITVGQFTPGPVFTTATFIGYLISGNCGAIVATIGIFTPAFFFVAFSAPIIPRLRGWRWTHPILDGLNVASLGLMVGAGIILSKGTVQTPYGLTCFVLNLILLIRFKLNSIWLILIAGIFGAVGVI